MATRPRYSEAQLGQYFDRIALPSDQRVLSVSALSDAEKSRYLAQILKHHQVRIPFENLTQHYSWHRVIEVNPQHLFRKIVEQPGRGGYCMEANTLFHTVLLSLGYAVYMAGSRVYSPDSHKYGGFGHCVNIVIIGADQVMVDVAFGANGPTKPLFLTHGAEQTQIAPASMRLIHESIPQNANQNSKVWIYQHRISKDHEWVPQYCFVDVEFIPEDIRLLNLGPSQGRSSFFTYRILMSRFTTSKESDGETGPRTATEAAVTGGEIDGAVFIDHDRLKWRRNGKTIVGKQFEGESERVSALEKYFGIVLSEEEKTAILGTAGALLGPRGMTLM